MLFKINWYKSKLEDCICTMLNSNSPGKRKQLQNVYKMRRKLKCFTKKNQLNIKEDNNSENEGPKEVINHIEKR